MLYTVRTLWSAISFLTTWLIEVGVCIITCIYARMILVTLIWRSDYMYVLHRYLSRGFLGWFSLVCALCSTNLAILFSLGRRGQKLARTSLTSGCRSVGIVCLRIKVTEFSFLGRRSVYHNHKLCGTCAGLRRFYMKLRRKIVSSMLWMLSLQGFVWNYYTTRHST
jgi:hypothetical protein